MKEQNMFFIHLAQDKDIVDTAIGAGDLTTLIRALTAAELVATLKGAGTFTVFAPTDIAFDKLPAETLTDLLKPENKAKLTRILKYHVLGRRVTVADINAMTLPAKVDMFDGGAVTISKVGNDLKVNNAIVTQADIMANNGVIHVIDTVLMPPTGGSPSYLYINQTLLILLAFIILFSIFRF